ncbi:MAG: hypothetical protein HY914_03610 [Desulfomonile tiedjei]|nr:hypothetical protein [Desulfomonile tiedjei]
MQPSPRPEAMLNVRAQAVFLPVAMSFAETSAIALGLGELEALSLRLATEEIFSYLCRKAAPDRQVRIRLTSGGYYVAEEFVFQAEDFNMRAFNLTASVKPGEDAALEETGLLIASRMVDRFKFGESNEGLRLKLIKERVYPAAEDRQLPPARPLEQYVVRSAEPEELKVFVRMVAGYHNPHVVPRDFAYPGKVTDMVASGEYRVLVVADRAGHIGGGLVWRREGARLVECFGPYVFNQPHGSAMAKELLDACIGAIARSKVVGLINRAPTPEFPTEYFERLGSLVLCETDGTEVELEAYYRELEEDLGSTVWTHPSLEAFLSAEYRRLVFPREIRSVTDEGETEWPCSVISAEVDRGQRRVTLRPGWRGRDCGEVVAAHAELFGAEGIPCIFFEVDLGKPWHAHFVPALLKSRFQPRLVLPWGGKGDLVVFQRS